MQVSFRIWWICSLIISILRINVQSQTVVASSVESNAKDLLPLLEKVSGVYTKRPATSQHLSLDKTVIVTACNHGFLNHLYNFDCFMKRLGMKYLVIALDKKAYQYLSNNTSIVTYYLPSENDVTSAPQEFRSRQFNIITTKKKEAVLTIMKLGYNVLFSDTDVAIVRDPFPYIIWQNVDYVHSLNAFCKVNEHWNFFYKSKLEGNTGFYYVRSNERTMKLWTDSIAAAPKFPRLDDQAVFWRVIRQSQDPPVLPIERCRDYTGSLVHPKLQQKYLITCMLDSCVFSSGMISAMYVPELTYETLMTNLKQLNETICTLHANYISGNKKKMNKMKEHGYWIVDVKPDGRYQCLAFHPRAAEQAVILKPEK